MVIDNSKEKERLNKQISAIKTSLEEHFKLKLFQDSVGEDELPDDFNYFILETGEIEMITEPKYSVGQNLYLTFYSENREDLTGDSLDIIFIDSKSFDSFSENGSQPFKTRKSRSLYRSIGIYV